MKNSWTAAAGLTVLVLCLSACDDADRAGLSIGKSSATAPTANVETVVVTWQPRDKTSEFLSAWRPKN